MTTAICCNACHAALKAEWRQAFDALRAAGLESDAEHPIAARYRSASNDVNHANRSRERFLPADGWQVCQWCRDNGEPVTNEYGEVVG